MPEGVIQRLIKDKGFGFVGSVGSEEGHFFHSSFIAKPYRFDALQEGQAVSFDLKNSQKKPGKQDAVNVRVIESQENVATVATATTSLLPYGFSTINTDQTVTEPPVWHDGSSGGDLLSGEILCTLKALTPLMPGNARYKVDEADPTKLQLQQWFGDLDKKKQIAEPLRLDDGRVVIAGSALKGMIRHSLGALLSAPMERVDELGKKVVLQDCLTPKDCEKVPKEKQNDKDVAPECLTGARLLFGYVRNDEDTPIGKGVFERLAGRITPNHAFSDGVPEFLGDEKKGYCVPLKVLGQPNPSAKNYRYKNGPKFFLHQPSVQNYSDIAAQGLKAIASKQSTLARFICVSGTKFKFTIRFARLRDWELGALLAVLEPHRLAKNGKNGQYAHKLGLGRPLGMGSICINTDKLRIRREKEARLSEYDSRAQWGENSLDALRKQKLSGEWLEMHAYTDHGRLDYPRRKK